MALKPKTSAIQFRVDGELLERFQERCDYHGVTVSAALRSAMHAMAEQFDVTMVSRTAKLAKAFPLAEAGQVSSEVRKVVVAPLRQPESLAERIKAERAAKKAKKLKRDERF